MSIKGVGQNTKVHETSAPKVEARKTEDAPKLQAPAGNQTRANDNAFQSAAVKTALNRAFDKGLGAVTVAGATAGATAANLVPTEAKSPIDYFQIDKEADDLIKKHTSDELFGSNLNTDDLGKELADIARTDPARAAALTDNVLDKVSGGDRDEVAQSMTEAMSPAELREYAKTDEGKRSLEQLRGHLDAGRTTGDEEDTMKRIDTAIKAAELEKSTEFQKLDSNVQQEILSRLERNEKNPAAVDNLLDLVKDANFQALPAQSQRALLRAFDNRPEDKEFVGAIKALANKPDFKTLNFNQQISIISDLDRFANTESYKGSNGFLGTGLGGHRVSAEDRTFLLDKLGDAAILNQTSPNPALGNTLNKIFSGDVKIHTYSEAAEDGRIEFGNNTGNGVLNINKHPDANLPGYGANNFADTIVHELNHELNQGAPHGTPDQFLNEYRAGYTGNEAAGTGISTSAAQQRDNIDNLITGYPRIRDLYNSDAKFKQFIDDVKKGLSETPPRLVDPEQMRQELVNAGFSSDYLNTPGNTDNH